MRDTIAFKDFTPLLDDASAAIRSNESYRLLPAAKALRHAMFPENGKPGECIDPELSLLLPYFMVVERLSVSIDGYNAAVSETREILKNLSEIKIFFPAPTLFRAIDIGEQNKQNGDLFLAAFAANADELFSHKSGPNITGNLKSYLRAANKAFDDDDMRTVFRFAGLVVMTPYHNRDKDLHGSAAELLLKGAKKILNKPEAWGRELTLAGQALYNVVVGGHDTDGRPEAVRQIGDLVDRIMGQKHPNSIASSLLMNSAFYLSKVAASASFDLPDLRDRTRANFFKIGYHNIQTGNVDQLQRHLRSMATFWNDPVIAGTALHFFEKASECANDKARMLKTLAEEASIFSPPESPERECAKAALAKAAQENGLRGHSNFKGNDRQREHVLNQVRLARNLEQIGVFIVRHNGPLPIHLKDHRIKEQRLSYGAFVPRQYIYG